MNSRTFQRSEIYSLITGRNNPECLLPHQTRCRTLELFFFTDHKCTLSAFLVMLYFLKKSFSVVYLLLPFAAIFLAGRNTILDGTATWRRVTTVSLRRSKMTLPTRLWHETQTSRKRLGHHFHKFKQRALV